MRTEEHRKLKNFDVVKIISAKSAVFAASRLLYVANTLVMGWALSKLGEADVTASSFIVSLQYVFVGISRGMLLSTGILAGEKNGAKQYAEVGKISRASWRLASTATLASAASLLIAPSILKISSIITSEVASATQNYMNYFALAVPAILLFASDKQLSVATKDAKISVMFNLIYAGIASGLGVPMALGYLGSAAAGAKALGISTAISAWLGLAAMRTYYHLDSRYQRFELYTQDKSQLKEYSKKLFELGWKIGAQSGAEFLNFMGTAFLFSAYGKSVDKPVVDMVTPVLQIGSALGLVAIGFGQAQAALISNERGALQKAFDKGDLISAGNARANISKIGSQGAIVSTVISGTIATVFYFHALDLVKSFVGNNLSFEQLDLSADILKISSMSLVFDTVRNVYAGNLSGFKDVNFVTMTNFVLMTVAFLSTSAGMLFSRDLVMPAMWARNISILSSAVINIFRWNKFNNLTTEDQAKIGRPSVLSSSAPLLAWRVLSLESYGSVNDNKSQKGLGIK